MSVLQAFKGKQMKIIQSLIGFILLLNIHASLADSSPIKNFSGGSYEQILSGYAGKGFMLVFWSMDCTRCVKDLVLISNLHKARPELKIVMVSVDELSLKDDIQALIDYYRLGDVDNWLFVENNSQSLFRDIDPAWNKELPRIYFFSETHHRESVSGEIKQYDLVSHFEKTQTLGSAFHNPVSKYMLSTLPPRI